MENYSIRQTNKKKNFERKGDFTSYIPSTLKTICRLYPKLAYSQRAHVPKRAKLKCGKTRIESTLGEQYSGSSYLSLDDNASGEVGGSLVLRVYGKYERKPKFGFKILIFTSYIPSTLKTICRIQQPGG